MRLRHWTSTFLLLMGLTTHALSLPFQPNTFKSGFFISMGGGISQFSSSINLDNSSASVYDLTLGHTSGAADIELGFGKELLWYQIPFRASPK